MTAKTEVATLVAQMNEALTSIHETIESLSKSAAESDAKLEELEKKRDRTLAELQAAYDKEREALAAARQKEMQDIAEKRRKEDEEREARRRREDDERAVRTAREDEERQAGFDAKSRSVEEEIDGIMDGIEDEAAKVIADGEAKLAELEEKRRDLNRLIEEQMRAALPTISTRKRTRTTRAGGGTMHGQPSPLPRGHISSATGEKGAGEASETIEERVLPEAKAEEETVPEPAGERGSEERKDEEAAAEAAAVKEKGCAGDDSQPPSEDVVAERSLEAASAKLSQTRVEETRPTEKTAPQDTEAEAGPEGEPASGGQLAAPRSLPPAVEAKEEPTPEQQQVVKEGHVSFKSKGIAPIEVRGLAVEVPKSVSAPTEDAVSEADSPADNDVVETKAPMEESATEIPAEDVLSEDHQAASESVPAAENTSRDQEPSAMEDSAAKEMPIAEIPDDEPEENLDAADTAPVEEAPMEEKRVVQEVEEPEQSPASDVSDASDASGAPDRADNETMVEISDKKKDEPFEDVTPERSPEKEDDDTPKMEEEQADEDVAQDDTREKAVFEMSNTEVAEEPSESELSVTDSAKKQESEPQVEERGDAKSGESGELGEPRGGLGETAIVQPEEQPEEQRKEADEKQRDEKTEPESHEVPNIPEVSSKAIELGSGEVDDQDIQDKEETSAQDVTAVDDSHEEESREKEEPATEIPPEVPTSVQAPSEEMSQRKTDPEEDDKATDEVPVEEEDQLDDSHHDKGSKEEESTPEEPQAAAPSPEETRQEELSSEEVLDEKVDLGDTTQAEEVQSVEGTVGKEDDASDQKENLSEEAPSSHADLSAEGDGAAQDEFAAEEDIDATNEVPVHHEVLVQNEVTAPDAPAPTEMDIAEVESQTDKESRKDAEAEIEEIGTAPPTIEHTSTSQDATVLAEEAQIYQQSEIDDEAELAVICEDIRVQNQDEEAPVETQEPTGEEKILIKDFPHPPQESHRKALDEEVLEPTKADETVEPDTRSADNGAKAQFDLQEKTQVEINEPCPTTREGDEEHLKTTTAGKNVDARDSKEDRYISQLDGEELSDGVSDAQGSPEGLSDHPDDARLDVAEAVQVDGAMNDEDVAQTPESDSNAVKEIETTEERRETMKTPEEKNTADDDDQPSQPEAVDNQSRPVEATPTQARDDEGEVPVAPPDEGTSNKASDVVAVEDQGEVDKSSDAEHVEAAEVASTHDSTAPEESQPESHLHGEKAPAGTTETVKKAAESLPTETEQVEEDAVGADEHYENVFSPGFEDSRTVETHDLKFDSTDGQEQDKDRTSDVEQEEQHIAHEDITTQDGSEEKRDESLDPAGQDELQHSEMSAEPGDTKRQATSDEDEMQIHLPSAPGAADDVHEASNPLFPADKHDHDESSANGVETAFETAQQNGERGEVEDDDASLEFQHDADFDESQGLGERTDLSVITEHTEPAASTAGDTSGVHGAGKTDEYMHLHPATASLGRSVSRAPDAAVESSYMTETTSMAADESHDQEDQDQDQEGKGFAPTAESATGHGDNSFASSSTKQVHFNDTVDTLDFDDDGNQSSPVLSVHDDDEDDDDEEEPSETYVNPFGRPTTAGSNGPPSQAAYNPFAQRTGTESSERPSRASYNPFAARRASDAGEAPYNPFARNTSTNAAADAFMRSASAPSNRSASPAAESFLRSAASSSFGSPSVEHARAVPGAGNPFARSTTPISGPFSPASSGVGPRSPGRGGDSHNPFVRSTSSLGHYEDETAYESTFGDPFVPRDLSHLATEHVPESSYNPFARRLSSSDRSVPPAVSALGSTAINTSHTNPFPTAAAGARGGRGRSGTIGGSLPGLMGGDVDETKFDQSFSSAGGQEHPKKSSGLDDSDDEMDDDTFPPTVSQLGLGSSPLSSRHVAVAPLDPIQERYNSELEDMDSDSEEASESLTTESLTTSLQFSPSQRRVKPPMPSIQERRGQGSDQDSEEEHGELASLNRQPPPGPSSQKSFYHDEGEDSSGDDGQHALAIHTHIAQSTQPDPPAASQFGATPSAPPHPPSRAPSSSQGHYGQEDQEDSSDEEQSDWDDAFTLVQPSTLAVSQVGDACTSPPSSPPGAPSSFSQSSFRADNEEDQGVLPSQAAQPFAMTLSEYQATPPPPPLAPHAPSSQGLHHQEQPDSSEDEEANIATGRPGQFPISSTSQYNTTPPTPPLQTPGSSSQGYYRRELVNSSDEQEDTNDAGDANATWPGQIQDLSTSQPPPLAPITLMQDRNRVEVEELDKKEEAWSSNANTYNQTLEGTMPCNDNNNNHQMVKENPMDPMRSAHVNPTGMSPTRSAATPMETADPMRTASPPPPTESPSTASGRRSSQDKGLPSRPREEEGAESDDSWQNINQRGDDDDGGVKNNNMSAAPQPHAGSRMPTPQLRVDDYEQQQQQQWSNASNDEVSTASSTYLAPAGPGDFTDTDSQQGSATPLASAGLSASSSQDTQGAMDSPRHAEETDTRDISIHNAAYGLEQASSSSSSSVQRMEEPDCDDDSDRPRTAVMSSGEPVTQFASSRFGSSTWRDELRSPTLFGAARHSHSESLREELQKSLHEDALNGHVGQLQTRQYQAEVHHVPAFGRDAYSQQEEEEGYGHVQQKQHQDQYGEPQYSPDYHQTQHNMKRMSSLEAELRKADAEEGLSSAEDDDDEELEHEHEHEHEHATPHLAPQRSDHAPDVSPLALHQETPATPTRDLASIPTTRGTPSNPASRGLDNSRHNPDRPQTPPPLPPSQSPPPSPSQPVVEEEEADPEFDPEAFVPRDVTNIPWHARTSSMPYSVGSQSTIDSMASSPVHSALPVDKHEPVIRDSWPASVHPATTTRPRNDSWLTDRSNDDPFKYDGSGGTKASFLSGAGPGTGPGVAGLVGSRSDSHGASRVGATGSSSNPGSLISRMRGIFESNNQATKHEPGSPVRSRPVSGVFHPIRHTTTTTTTTTTSGDDENDENDGNDNDNNHNSRRLSGSPPGKTGLANDAEDDVDEKSALLRDAGGGLGAN